jgi:mono/diheme cytochrome c family protein
MARVQINKKFRFLIGIVTLIVGMAVIGTGSWVLYAADEPSAKAESAEGAAPAPQAAAGGEECCKPGDTTPPLELVKKIPPGGLHSPYQDWAKLAKEEELVKQFRLPGCNECHGGGGGGGFCPALSQGVWFWGNTDDVLFRLVTLGSADLEKQGFTRIQYGTVHAGMPMMGHTIKTADHLWKIIAFIRSINPPGSNPPEKVVPARMHPIGEAPPPG